MLFFKSDDFRAYLVPAAVAVVGFGAIWWYKRKKQRYYKPVGVVSALNVYPVKSCQGIPLHQANCLPLGIKYDRQLVILNDKDEFTSQRSNPSLALVQVTVLENEKLFQLDAPGMKTLKIPLEAPNTKTTKKIRVWRMTGEGVFAGEHVAEWFSNYLEGSFKLYYCTTPRSITDDEKWGDIGKPQDKLQFADFAPYLLATEASLEAVNEGLSYPVTVKRFRPNIVIGGVLEPHAEDTWEYIKIGGAEFRKLKECGRCKMIKVNPETGKMDAEEPLATLKRTRSAMDKRHGSAPLFGIHMALESEGTVSIGDTVFVSAAKTRCRKIFPLFT